MLSKVTSGLLPGGIAQTGLNQENSAVETAKSLDKINRNDPAKVEEAATKFEALLLHQLIRSMWSTVEEEGLFGENDNASQIFRDMLNENIAKVSSEGAGIGIKKYIKRELLGADATSNPRKA